MLIHSTAVCACKHAAFATQKLLDLGANPNYVLIRRQEKDFKKNCWVGTIFPKGHGCTPLMLAVLAKKPEIVEELLCHGANSDFIIKCGTFIGWTPFSYAVETINYENIKGGDPKLKKIALLFIQHRAKHTTRVQSLRYRGRFGFTPLHLAIWWNCKEVFFELLKRHDIDVNVRVKCNDTWEGCTPLYFAVDSDNVEFVKALLAKGAYPHLRAKNKKPLLDLMHKKSKKYFTSSRRDKIINLLLNYPQQNGTYYMDQREKLEMYRFNYYHDLNLKHNKNY